MKNSTLNRKARLAVAAILTAILVPGCGKEQTTPSGDDGSRESIREGETEIRFTVEKTGPGEVSDLSVFQFEADRLYRTYHFSEAVREFTAYGLPGHGYRFRIAAGLGDITGSVPAGSGEAALGQIVVRPGDAALSDPDHPAMADRDGVEIDFATGTTQGSVTLEPLCARVQFRYSTADMKDGSFTPTALILRQTPRQSPVFSQEGKADSPSQVTDMAIPAEDIATLASGGTLTLLCLENRQGEVRGISSQDEKTPERIPEGKRETATYLELQGTYTSKDGTLTSANTYRCLLGENQTTSLDVTRGRTIDVVFELSANVQKGWKVDWNYRRLRFLEGASRTVTALKDKVTLVMEPEAFDCGWEVSGGLRGGAVSVSEGERRGNTVELVIDNGHEHPTDIAGTIDAVAADGSARASIEIRVPAWRNTEVSRTHRIQKGEIQTTYKGEKTEDKSSANGSTLYFNLAMTVKTLEVTVPAAGSNGVNFDCYLPVTITSTVYEIYGRRQEVTEWDEVAWKDGSTTTENRTTRTDVLEDEKRVKSSTVKSSGVRPYTTNPAKLRDSSQGWNSANYCLTHCNESWVSSRKGAAIVVAPNTTGKERTATVDVEILQSSANGPDRVHAYVRIRQTAE